MSLRAVAISQADNAKGSDSGESLPFAPINYWNDCLLLAANPHSVKRPVHEKD
jgi:hypothetical protein